LGTYRGKPDWWKQETPRGQSLDSAKALRLCMAGYKLSRLLPMCLGSRYGACYSSIDTTAAASCDLPVDAT